MEGLHNVIQFKKVKNIGISNCYAYQLTKRWEGFISIQGHYNIIFREEEREMSKLYTEDNIAWQTKIN